jgi:hypothetical protein
MIAQDTITEEMALVQAYRQQADHYRDALHQAGELLETLRAGQDSGEVSRQLAAALEAVAGVETRIAPLKQRWRERAHKPGPQLRNVLTQVTELLIQLMDRIDQASRQAAERQAGLMPELDRLARGQQMHRSYRWVRGDGCSGGRREIRGKSPILLLKVARGRSYFPGRISPPPPEPVP